MNFKEMMSFGKEGTLPFSRNGSPLQFGEGSGVRSNRNVIPHTGFLNSAMLHQE